MSAMFGSIDAEQLRLVAPGESIFGRADAWAIPVIGSLVTQEVITRFLAARSTATAKAACFSAAGLYVVIGMLPVLIGLSGTHLNIAGAVGDNFIPAVAVQLLPPVLAIVFIGAILSTVDSNLLAVSSLISVNLLNKFHARSSDRTRLLIARLTTVAAGIAALGVALAGSDIYELIAMTSVFGQGGILVATLFALHSRFGGKWAALCSVYVCVAFNLMTLVFMPLQTAMAGGLSFGAAMQAVLAGDVEPIAGYFLYSVGLSIAAYLAVGVFEGSQRVLREAD